MQEFSPYLLPQYRYNAYTFWKKNQSLLEPIEFLHLPSCASLSFFHSRTSRVSEGFLLWQNTEQPCTGSKVRAIGFKLSCSWLCELELSLISLCLSTLICQIGTIMVSITEVFFLLAALLIYIINSTYLKVGFDNFWHMYTCLKPSPPARGPPPHRVYVIMYTEHWKESYK